WNACDFIYIAPSCPHQGHNGSRTSRVVFVVARADALEQEHMVVGPDPDNGSSAARVDSPTARWSR
ncbi:MAG: hypothetical protein WCD11_07875, partial [Solirubrobacteraceae bacterium]